VMAIFRSLLAEAHFSRSAAKAGRTITNRTTSGSQHRATQRFDNNFEGEVPSVIVVPDLIGRCRLDHRPDIVALVEFDPSTSKPFLKSLRDSGFEYQRDPTLMGSIRRSKAQNTFGRSSRAGGTATRSAHDNSVFIHADSTKTRRTWSRQLPCLFE